MRVLARQLQANRRLPMEIFEFNDTTVGSYSPSKRTPPSTFGLAARFPRALPISKDSSEFSILDSTYDPQTVHSVSHNRGRAD